MRLRFIIKVYCSKYLVITMQPLQPEFQACVLCFIFQLDQLHCSIRECSILRDACSFATTSCIGIR